MTKKSFNPRRLNVAELARRGSALSGEQALAALTRLQQPGEPEADPLALLKWTARAEHRPVRVGPPELWLHLTLHTTVQRTCQRCLQLVDVPLAMERNFLFAPNEAQAEAWDAERDDADVLVFNESFDLMDLAEDEVLLALPLVPRHDTCPQPLAATAGPLEEAQLSPKEPKKDNPFAILAQLKRTTE